MRKDLTSREILCAARKIISDPSRWHQGSHFKDADAAEVFYFAWHNPDFVVPPCCGFGAIMSVAPKTVEARTALNKVCLELHDMRFPTFNDAATTTHADILAVFDAAIAKETLCAKL